MYRATSLVSAAMLFATSICSSSLAATTSPGTTTTTTNISNSPPAGTPAAPSTSIPNDNSNYGSDRLTWSSAVEATDKPGDGPIYCLPPRTTVIGTKSSLDTATSYQTTTTTATDTGGNTTSSTSPATATQQQWQQVRLAEQKFPYILNPITQDIGSDGVGKYLILPSGDARSQWCPNVSSNSKAATKLYQGTTFYVSDTSLNSDSVSRIGWEYGALAVPFKLQLSKGGTITSSTSVGPYLGFRIPFFDTGIVFSPVAFAGVAPISVSTTTNGTASSQELAAISYGGGLIASVKDSFQLGLIFGADHVNPNSNYPYNDKLWVSFAIGYSFAQ